MEKNIYVTWPVFIWVMGIFVVVIGWQVTSITRLADTVDPIKTQLSQIQTDLQWIKSVLAEHTILHPTVNTK